LDGSGEESGLVVFAMRHGHCLSGISSSALGAC
jgi:hypothetical protein